MNLIFIYKGIIQKIFQGKLQIESQTIINEPEEGKEKFQKTDFESDRGK